MAGSQFSQLDAWYHRADGLQLLAWEQSLIQDFLMRAPGDFLLQLGGTRDLQHSQSSTIIRKLYCSDSAVFVSQNYSGRDYSIQDHSAQNYSVQVDFKQLPLLPNSVDMVVLVHALEFISDPEQLLAELYQALVPGGKLILVNFNPWSAWGLKARWKGKKDMPWQAKLYSLQRIKRWLRALNYRILMRKTSGFYPLNLSQEKRKKLLFLEPLGQLLFPGCGNVYVVVAEKSSAAIIKPKLAWRTGEVAVG